MAVPRNVSRFRAKPRNSVWSVSLKRGPGDCGLGADVHATSGRRPPIAWSRFRGMGENFAGAGTKENSHLPLLQKDRWLWIERYQLGLASHVFAVAKDWPSR